jgi:hypothetical protein
LTDQIHVSFSFLFYDILVGAADAQEVSTHLVPETPHGPVDGFCIRLVHVGGLSLFDGGGLLQ